MNGALIGIASAAVVFVYTQKPLLAACMVVGMVCNTFVAGAVGSILPLGLRRVGIDPALASGPIATTFTDICGFSVFLGVATFMLHRFGAL